MALVLMRMKLAILRHSATGDRAIRMVNGGALGLLLAGGTVALAVVAPALLPVAFAAWALGWVAGPVLLGGGETLRPEHFTMLGIPPARLAAGLLAAALVGVAPLATLVAFAALVVYGARLGPGPALVALLRHGPEPAALQGGPAQASLPPLPLGQTVVVYVCWSLAWLPLFPQGLVPLAFKLAGSPVRSWFLPLYLPPAWQWPVILGMIALGLAMVGTAVAIPRRHARRHLAVGAPGPAPTRLPCCRQPPAAGGGGRPARLRPGRRPRAARAAPGGARPNRLR